MKGGQIQASGLDHPVGWPRIHTAVATKGLRAGGLRKRSSTPGPNYDIANQCHDVWGDRPVIARKGAGRIGQGRTKYRRPPSWGKNAHRFRPGSE